MNLTRILKRLKALWTDFLKLFHHEPQKIIPKPNPVPKILWEEGYQQWIAYRTSVINAAGYINGTISSEEMTRLLGDGLNKGRGDFFVEAHLKEHR